MSKTRITTTIGVALAAAAVITAPSANAEPITVCPEGNTAVGPAATCEFAHNVRIAWFSQPGLLVTAYSPVTGDAYMMQCAPGFTVQSHNGAAEYNAVRCLGGDNAIVYVWLRPLQTGVSA